MNWKNKLERANVNKETEYRALTISPVHTYSVELESRPIRTFDYRLITIIFNIFAWFICSWSFFSLRSLFSCLFCLSLMAIMKQKIQSNHNTISIFLLFRRPGIIPTELNILIVLKSIFRFRNNWINSFYFIYGCHQRECNCHRFEMDFLSVPKNGKFHGQSSKNEIVWRVHCHSTLNDVIKLSNTFLLIC